MNSKDEIRRALEEARANTLRLVADVSEDDFCRQAHPDFSPLGWHLGHIGVTEAYWILQQCKREPSLSAFFDFFFVPTDNPKPNRVNLPARADILRYLHTEREQVFAFLTQTNFPSDHSLLREGNIFNMLLQHEEQHNETMLIILQLLAAAHYDRRELETSSSGGHSPPYLELMGQRRAGCACHHRSKTHILASSAYSDAVHVPAGPFAMGSNDLATTLDNERQQHTVNVAAFFIDPWPVSNNEFLYFIESGGYHARQWWTPAGWQWREKHGVEYPLYWRRKHSDDWCEVSLTDGARSLALDQPVTCVSWYEADAYARFVGKRLPTEAEWEKAVGEDYLQASGHVWEWTSSWFQPYPGFAAHPYDGYSAPYFDQQHYVLRGGSWATQPHVRRTTFRNWYQPWVREIFAGVRCVRDG